AALQRTVRRRRVLGDQERQEDADGHRLHLQRDHDRLLGESRRGRTARDVAAPRPHQRREGAAGAGESPIARSGAVSDSQDHGGGGVLMSFSREDVKAITDKVLNMAKADAVEVTFAGGERSATRYANSTITANLVEHDQSIFVTVRFGQKSATTSTHQFD